MFESCLRNKATSGTAYKQRSGRFFIVRPSPDGNMKSPAFQPLNIISCRQSLLIAEHAADAVRCVRRPWYARVAAVIRPYDGRRNISLTTLATVKVWL